MILLNKFQKSVYKLLSTTINLSKKKKRELKNRNKSKNKKKIKKKKTNRLNKI